ncbi:MAG: PilZ domain-containing protein [Candidatus Omnitrophica bacterium]|nr:PilZ domain-containing protein [Candidatus Omnitrophota bacterium]
MSEEFKGKERRVFPRASANFIISYRMTDPPSDYDLSQSKNVSQGGILLTTNQYFEKDSFLAMTIRFPFVTKRIDVTGKVVGCKEVVKSIIYETHVQFIDLDMTIFEEIGRFVNQLLDHK